MKLTIVLSMAVMSVAPMVQAQDLPAGPGRDVFARMCSACHETTVVTGRRMSKQGWTSTVDEMVGKGASGTDTEIDQVIEYLSANFGPKKPKVNINKADSKQLSADLSFTPEESDAIVQYRTKNGDFKELSDVKKVSGVDAKKVDDKKDLIAF